MVLQKSTRAIVGTVAWIEITSELRPVIALLGASASASKEDVVVALGVATLTQLVQIFIPGEVQEDGNSLGQGQSRRLVEEGLDDLELWQKALEEHGDLRCLVSLATAFMDDIGAAGNKSDPSHDRSATEGHGGGEEVHVYFLQASNGTWVKV